MAKIIRMTFIFLCLYSSASAGACPDILNLSPPYEQCSWDALVKTNEAGKETVFKAKFYYMCGAYRIDEEAGAAKKTYIIKGGRIYIPNYESRTIFVDSDSRYANYIGRLLPFVVNAKKQEGSTGTVFLGLNRCKKEKYGVLRQASSMYVKAKLTEYRDEKNRFMRRMEIKAPKHELNFGGGVITAGPLSETYKAKRLKKMKSAGSLFDIPADMAVYDIEAEYKKRAAESGITIKPENTIKFKAGKK